MAYVVTGLCIDCKHTHCVDVCPVECFHEGERQLWIDPSECIDCAACVPECPENAIFPVKKVPREWRTYITLNAEKAKELPLIIEGKPPLSGADGCADSA